MRPLMLTLALLASGALAQTQAPAQTAPAQTTPAQAAPADASAVVARIGSETITLGDFDRQFRVFVGRLVNNQGMPFSEEMLPSFAQYRPQVLEQLAQQKAVGLIAQRAGARVDPARVEEALARTRGNFGTDEEFAEALAGAGYGSVEQLREAIAENLLVRNYVESLRGRFTFQPSVVQSYYQANRERFTRPAQACVKHILVPDAQAAQQARERLAAGEEFAAVAQDVSKDPGSAARGGELGCFERGVTVPEFDKASFEGPLNELQQVKTQFGEHLLIVTERNEAGVVPFEQAQEQIREQLAEQAVQKLIEQRVASLNVQTFPELVQVAAPEAPQPKND